MWQQEGVSLRSPGMPGNEVPSHWVPGDWQTDVPSSSGELANEDSEPSGTAWDRRATDREESPLGTTGRWARNVLGQVARPESRGWMR